MDTPFQAPGLGLAVCMVLHFVLVIIYFCLPYYILTSQKQMMASGPAVSYQVSGQGLSQVLETGCPKLAIVKFWGIHIFKGEHNILRFQTQTCIHLSK